MLSHSGVSGNGQPSNCKLIIFIIFSSLGFHLSGVVTQPAPHTTSKQSFNVAITFDRGLVTSCQCSCEETAAWCEHANALCIYRITHKDEVSLRSPVSESLSRLERNQLQKFAQYLISEMPQQVSFKYFFYD